MYRRIMLVLATAAALLLLPAGAAFAQAGDKDCPDFATREEAQKYFEDNGGSTENNFDRLDRDRDGQACEANESGEAPAGDEPAKTEPVKDEEVAQEPPATTPAGEDGAEPTPAPAVDGADDGDGGDEAPGALPFTGPRAPGLVAVGIGLLGLGAVALFVTRYRHQH